MLVSSSDASALSGSNSALIGSLWFAALLVAASIYDIRSRRIPNTLVLTMLTSGAVYAVITGGLRDGATALGAGVLGLLLWLPFYAVRWIGAGDVKLFAAAALWLGPMRTIEAAFVSAFAGGALSVLWMVRAYGVNGASAAVSMAVATPRRGVRLSEQDASRVLPYGVAMAIGILATVWWTTILKLVTHAAN